MSIAQSFARSPRSAHTAPRCAPILPGCSPSRTHRSASRQPPPSGWVLPAGGGLDPHGAKVMRDYLLPKELVDKARAVVEANRKAGRKVAVAESCTGGLVCAALTEIAGSSEVL